MKNIAIFASGSGTNAENITRYLLTVKTLMLRLFYQITVMLACMGG